MAVTQCRLRAEHLKANRLKADDYQKYVSSKNNPHEPAGKLHGRKVLYKIKLKLSIYHLAYTFTDDVVAVFFISVGKREKDNIYKSGEYRDKSPDLPLTGHRHRQDSFVFFTA